MLVGNRETAVIVGLIRNVVSEFETGVPVLKNEVQWFKVTGWKVLPEEQH